MIQIKFENLEYLSTFLNSLTQFSESLKIFISNFEKFTVLPIEGINPIYYDDSDLLQKTLKISFVFGKRIFLDDNVYIEKNLVFPNLIFVEKNLRQWLEKQMELKFKIDSFLVEYENTFELFLFCLKLMESKARNFDKSKIYIHKSAVIHKNVVIGNNVYIGENSVIYPNCVIYDNVYIGSNVILHSNSVIGSDGFGYTTENEKIIKIPQEGGVVIKDGVEIGSCTCIDRATIGYTYIGENTKIDNLVQIGHNVKIGKNCRIAGKSGIAGSARIYENSIIAAMSGVRDGIKIGPNSILAGASSATKNIPPNQIYAGNPARPFHQHFRELAQQTKRS